MAVQMGGKGDPLLGDLAQLGQAEHLESAAVGQDGAIPAGELVQAAHLCHQLVPRAQVEVVGVAEHDLGADLLQVMGGQAALDGAGGGDILERRRLDGAVYRAKLAPTAECSCFRRRKVVSDAIFDPFLMRGEQPRAYADRAAFDTYCHIIPAADGFCNHPAVFPGPGRDIPGAYSGKPGGKAMQNGWGSQTPPPYRYP